MSLNNLEDAKFEIETPLLYSHPLSGVVSHPVFLKLENTQPCNSFKIRGTANICRKKVEEGIRTFVTVSGGNAGFTLAYTCLQMNVKCCVFLPEFVTQNAIDRIKGYGADITVCSTAKECFVSARAKVAETPNAHFVHPYDNPDIWHGYAKIVREIQQQLKGVKPGCIVTSVGGGGLLRGLLFGMEEIDWKDVPVLAMETIGAHCFNQSVIAGKIVENLNTSIAKTLGAPSVVPSLLDILPEFKVLSRILPDSQALEACFSFAEDHKFLVEAACGVSLATLYANQIFEMLESGGVPNVDGPIVVIVCGGTDCTPSILNTYAREIGLET